MPKELLVKALHPCAPQWRKALQVPGPWHGATQHALPSQPGLRLAQWQSLYELFAYLPDAHSPHNGLHSVRSSVTIAAALATLGSYLTISDLPLG